MIATDCYQLNNPHIHMNGRIYDPTLGRFLQADPYIQAPENSQSYNRYSYVLNNPLSYTDPSGFIFKKIGSFLKKNFKTIAAIALGYVTFGLSTGAWTFAEIGKLSIGALIGGGAASGFVSGAVQTGSLRGALQGAISGAIFGAIGGAGLGGFETFALNGLAGGLMQDLQGGKFGHGFWSAGLGSALGGKFGKTPIGRVISSAVIGGTISALTGGKFANGALSAAFASALRSDWASNEVGKKQLAVSTEQGDSDVGTLFESCNDGNSNACTLLQAKNEQDLNKAYEFIENHAPELIERLGGLTSQGTLENITFDNTEEYWARLHGHTENLSGKIVLSSNYSSMGDLIDTLAHEMVHSGDGYWGRVGTNFQDSYFSNSIGYGQRHMYVDSISERMRNLYEAGKIH